MAVAFKKQKDETALALEKQSASNAAALVKQKDDTAAALERAGADIVLLDNMTPEELAQAVALVDGQVATEASGGVNEETIAAIAQTGVDIISVGALTHSAVALDIRLDLTPL